MTAKKQTDERIIAQKMKTESECFRILFTGLIIIIMFRMYILKVTIWDILPEAILFFIACLYFMSRSISFGNGNEYMDFSNEGRKKSVRKSLLLSLLGALIFRILDFICAGEFVHVDMLVLIISFVLLFLFLFAWDQFVYRHYYHKHKKKEKEINSQFDEE